MRVATVLLLTTLLSSVELGAQTSLRRKYIDDIVERLQRLISREDDVPSLADAIEYLSEYNDEATKLGQVSSLLQFTFVTNVTDEISAKIQENSVKDSSFSVEQKAKVMKYYNNSAEWPFDIHRQLEDIAESVVSKDLALVRERSKLASGLESIYAKAKVCEPSGDNCLDLEPDLLHLMATSRDYDQLLWAWKGWHDAAGPDMKPLYVRLVDIMNQNARDNGYANETAIWMGSNDETNPDGFEQLCDKLMAELMPLYEQLHAYVRGRLSEHYGGDRVGPDEAIPVHLLGNMWAQDWSNINDLVNPYPNKLFQEAQNGMKKNNLQPLDLFKIAEEFYTSIDLFPMTEAFWNYSMLTKPTDGRVVQCHAAAHNMGTKDDFRIHMCAEVDMFNFYVIHHEMGHIEYYMAYANQPYLFQSGAHSGFHEAIGDTIGLSVVTPKHLATLGLVDAAQDTDENSIAFLLNLALQKVAFPPFGYTIDKWRWSVFRGDIQPEDYTTSWWNMHLENRGVAPAVPRDDPGLFDPGAKYHVPAGVPYVRYFISHLLQFHFHESLCAIAGHEGPLHKCDIYGSKEAGDRFMKMLRMGSSRPWPDALEVVTGSRMFTTAPLLRYFEPLRQWLVKQNEDNGYPVGW